MPNKTPHAPPWIRGTALATLACFLYVNVVDAALAPARSLWEERQVSIGKAHPDRAASQGSSLLAQLPAADAGLLPGAFRAGDAFELQGGASDRRAAAIPGNVPAVLKSIPSACASVKELYLPPGYRPGDLLVLHVQDVHENAQAQKNIAGIVAAVNGALPADGSAAIGADVNPRLLVGLEGAAGPFNLAAFRDESDRKTTEELASYFLKTSLITGPEYAGMTEARLPLFWGLEDPALYNAHVSAFKESVPLEKEAAETYRGLAETLAGAQRRVFNPELRELDRRRALYEGGELKLGDYLQFLSQGTPLSSFPQAQAFLQSLDLERKLDYARIEGERREVAQALARALPKDRLAELARAAVAYRTGAVGHAAFYRYLDGVCRSAGIRLENRPQLGLYIRYAMSADRIQPERLFRELSALEKLRWDRAAESPEERDLVQLSRDLGLVGGLFKFNLTPRQWEAYSTAQARVERIPERLAALSSSPAAPDSVRFRKLLARFEKFNEMAIARNRALVDNLLAKASQKPREEDFHPAAPARENSLRFTTLSERIGRDGRPDRLALKAELSGKGGRRTLRVLADRAGLPLQVSDQAAVAELDLAGYHVRLYPYGNGFWEKILGSLEAPGEPERDVPPAPLPALEARPAAPAKTPQVRAALLVAGGFHTEGLCKLLKEKKVAYAVLAPALGKVEGDGSNYLNVFRRGKTPLEKLFTEDRITLARTPASAAVSTPSSIMLARLSALARGLKARLQPGSAQAAFTEISFAVPFLAVFSRSLMRGQALLLHRLGWFDATLADALGRFQLPAKVKLAGIAGSVLSAGIFAAAWLTGNFWPGLPVALGLWALTAGYLFLEAHPENNSAENGPKPWKSWEKAVLFSVGAVLAVALTGPLALWAAGLVHLSILAALPGWLRNLLPLPAALALNVGLHLGYDELAARFGWPVASTAGSASPGGQEHWSDPYSAELCRMIMDQLRISYPELRSDDVMARTPLRYHGINYTCEQWLWLPQGSNWLQTALIRLGDVFIIPESVYDALGGGLQGRLSNHVFVIPNGLSRGGADFAESVAHNFRIVQNIFFAMWHSDITGKAVLVGETPDPLGSALLGAAAAQRGAASVTIIHDKPRLRLPNTRSEIVVIEPESAERSLSLAMLRNVALFISRAPVVGEGESLEVDVHALAQYGMKSLGIVWRVGLPKDDDEMGQTVLYVDDAVVVAGRAQPGEPGLRTGGSMDVNETPVRELLAALDLSDPAAISSRQVPVEEDAQLREQGLHIRRIRIRQDDPSQKLQLLRSELLKGTLYESHEEVCFDLLYNGNGHLIAVVPAVHNGKFDWAKAMLEHRSNRPTYIDLTAYYIQLPARRRDIEPVRAQEIYVREMKAAWGMLADAQAADRELIAHYLMQSGLVKMNRVESEYQGYKSYVLMDLSAGGKGRFLEFDPADYDKIVDSDPRYASAYVVPVYPCVYSPGHSDHVQADMDYHTYLYNALYELASSARPVSGLIGGSPPQSKRVLIVGCGSGAEILGAARQPGLEPYALDISPLAIANSRCAARINSFSIPDDRIIRHDNIADRHNGDRKAFGEQRFDLVAWGMPYVKEEQHGQGLISYWDGEDGTVLSQFLRFLPELLTQDGYALIWNGDNGAVERIIQKFAARQGQDDRHLRLVYEKLDNPNDPTYCVYRIRLSQQAVSEPARDGARMSLFNLRRSKILLSLLHSQNALYRIADIYERHFAWLESPALGLLAGVAVVLAVAGMAAGLGLLASLAPWPALIRAGQALDPRLGMAGLYVLAQGTLGTLFWDQGFTRLHGILDAEKMERLKSPTSGQTRAPPAAHFVSFMFSSALAVLTALLAVSQPSTYRLLYHLTLSLLPFLSLPAALLPVFVGAVAYVLTHSSIHWFHNLTHPGEERMIPATRLRTLIGRVLLSITFAVHGHAGPAPQAMDATRVDHAYSVSPAAVPTAPAARFSARAQRITLAGLHFLRLRVPNPKAKVLVVEPITPALLVEFQKRYGDADFDVILPESELVKAANGWEPGIHRHLKELVRQERYDYVIGYVNEQFDAEFFAMARIRGLLLMSTGVHNINFEAAAEQGTIVTNAAGPTTTPVAEELIAFALDSLYSEAVHRGPRKDAVRLSEFRPGSYDDASVAQILWYALLRKTLRLEHMFRFGASDKYVRTGVGGEATVYHEKLGQDRHDGAATSIGIVGLDEIGMRVAELAIAHEVSKVYVLEDELDDGKLARLNERIRAVLAVSASDSLVIEIIPVTLRELVRQATYVVKTPQARWSVRRLPAGSGLVDAREIFISDARVLHRSLSGLSVGILGLGRIGEATAQRLIALGASVIVDQRDHHRQQYQEKLARLAAWARICGEGLAHEIGIRYVDRQEFLAHSNVLLVSSSINPETRGFLDSDALREFGTAAAGGARAIVTVVQDIIAEGDLIQYLRSHPHVAVRMDVVSEEHLGDAQRRFNDASGRPLNVRIAGHSGAAVLSMRVAKVQRVLGNLRELIDNQPASDALDALTLARQLRQRSPKDAAIDLVGRYFAWLESPALGLLAGAAVVLAVAGMAAGLGLLASLAPWPALIQAGQALDPRLGMAGLYVIAQGTLGTLFWDQGFTRLHGILDAEKMERLKSPTSGQTRAPPAAHFVSFMFSSALAVLTALLAVSQPSTYRLLYHLTLSLLPFLSLPAALLPVFVGAVAYVLTHSSIHWFHNLTHPREERMSLVPKGRFSPGLFSRWMVQFRRGLLAVLIRAVYGTPTIEWEGTFPKEGPFIVVFNHPSRQEPIFVSYLLARAGYDAKFLAHYSWFKGPMGLVMRLAGCIPVGAPDQNGFALQSAVEHLQQGGIIALAPQGERTVLNEGLLQADQVHTGAFVAAILAAQADKSKVLPPIVGVVVGGDIRSSILPLGVARGGVASSGIASTRSPDYRIRVLGAFNGMPPDAANWDMSDANAARQKVKERIISPFVDWMNGRMLQMTVQRGRIHHSSITFMRLLGVAAGAVLVLLGARRWMRPAIKNGRHFGGRPFRFPEPIWGEFKKKLQNIGTYYAGDVEYSIYELVKEHGLAWTDDQGQIHWIDGELERLFGKQKAKKLSRLIWHAAWEAMVAVRPEIRREKRDSPWKVFDLKEMVAYHENLHVLLRRPEIEARLGRFKAILSEPGVREAFVSAFESAYGKPHASEPSRSPSTLDWHLEEFLVLIIQEGVVFQNARAVYRHLAESSDALRSYPGLLDRFEEAMTGFAGALPQFLRDGAADRTLRDPQVMSDLLRIYLNFSQSETSEHRKAEMAYVRLQGMLGNDQAPSLAADVDIMLRPDLDLPRHKVLIYADGHFTMDVVNLYSQRMKNEFAESVIGIAEISQGGSFTLGGQRYSIAEKYRSPNLSYVTALVRAGEVLAAYAPDGRRVYSQEEAERIRVWTGGRIVDGRYRKDATSRRVAVGASMMPKEILADHPDCFVRMDLNSIGVPNVFAQPWWENLPSHSYETDVLLEFRGGKLQAAYDSDGEPIPYRAEDRKNCVYAGGSMKGNRYEPESGQMLGAFPGGIRMDQMDQWLDQYGQIVVTNVELMGGGQLYLGQPWWRTRILPAYDHEDGVTVVFKKNGRRIHAPLMYVYAKDGAEIYPAQILSMDPQGENALWVDARVDAGGKIQGQFVANFPTQQKKRLPLQEFNLVPLLEDCIFDNVTLDKNGTLFFLNNPPLQRLGKGHEPVIVVVKQGLIQEVYRKSGQRVYVKNPDPRDLPNCVYGGDITLEGGRFKEGGGEKLIRAYPQGVPREELKRLFADHPILVVRNVQLSPRGILYLGERDWWDRRKEPLQYAGAKGVTAVFIDGCLWHLYDPSGREIYRGLQGQVLSLDPTQPYALWVHGAEVGKDGRLAPGSGELYGSFPGYSELPVVGYNLTGFLEQCVIANVPLNGKGGLSFQMDRIQGLGEPNSPVTLVVREGRVDQVYGPNGRLLYYALEDHADWDQLSIGKRRQRINERLFRTLIDSGDLERMLASLGVRSVVGILVRYYDLPSLAAWQYVNDYVVGNLSASPASGDLIDSYTRESKARRRRFSFAAMRELAMLPREPGADSEDILRIIADDAIQAVYNDVVEDTNFLNRLKAESANLLNTAFLREVYQRVYEHYTASLYYKIEGLREDKIQLKYYQRSGVRFIIDKQRVLLADEQGLGKTIQVIAAALNVPAREEGGRPGANKVLVVCNKSAKNNWRDEVARYTVLGDEGAYVIEDLAELRVPARLAKIQAAKFVIINYEALSTKRADLRDRLKQLGFDFIVADEAHRIRNETLYTDALREFDAPYKVLLTGTPLIGSRLGKIFNLLNWLYPNDAAFHYSQKSLFPKRYRVGSVRSLRRLGVSLERFMLRRLKSQVYADFPAKFLRVHRVQLTDYQRSLYEPINAAVIALLSRELGSGGPHPRLRNVLPLLTALQQVTLQPGLYRYHLVLRSLSDPSRLFQVYRGGGSFSMEVGGRLREFQVRTMYKREDDIRVTDKASNASYSTERQAGGRPVIKIEGEEFSIEIVRDVMESEKTREVDRIVAEAMRNGRSVVIFSRFRAAVQYFAERYAGQRFRVSLMTGEMSGNQRTEAMQGFASEGGIFLTTYGTGGESVNLQRASEVVLLDVPWNAQGRDQAIDRVYRLGQTRDVTVHELVCSGTIDEYVLRAVDRSEAVAQAILGDDMAAEEDDEMEQILSRSSVLNMVFREFIGQNPTGQGPGPSPQGAGAEQDIRLDQPEGSVSIRYGGDRNSIEVAAAGRRWSYDGFIPLLREIPRLPAPARGLIAACLRNQMREEREALERGTSNEQRTLFWSLLCELYPAFRKVDYNLLIESRMNAALLILQLLLENGGKDPDPPEIARRLEGNRWFSGMGEVLEDPEPLAYRAAKFMYDTHLWDCLTQLGVLKSRYKLEGKQLRRSWNVELRFEKGAVLYEDERAAEAILGHRLGLWDPRSGDPQPPRLSMSQQRALAREARHGNLSAKGALLEDAQEMIYSTARAIHERLSEPGAPPALELDDLYDAGNQIVLESLVDYYGELESRSLDQVFRHILPFKLQLYAYRARRDLRSGVSLNKPIAPGAKVEKIDTLRAAPAQAPSGDLEETELGQKIREVLDGSGFGEDEINIFFLYADGRSSREIAEDLHLNPIYVKSVANQGVLAVRGNAEILQELMGRLRSQNGGPQAPGGTMEWVRRFFFRHLSASEYRRRAPIIETALAMVAGTAAYLVWTQVLPFVPGFPWVQGAAFDFHLLIWCIWGSFVLGHLPDFFLKSREPLGPPEGHLSFTAVKLGLALAIAAINLWLTALLFIHLQASLIFLSAAISSSALSAPVSIGTPLLLYSAAALFFHDLVNRFSLLATHLFARSRADREDVRLMREAIAEADPARYNIPRGNTFIAAVIADEAGNVLGRGHNEGHNILHGEHFALYNLFRKLLRAQPADWPGRAEANRLLGHIRTLSRFKPKDEEAKLKIFRDAQEDFLELNALFGYPLAGTSLYVTVGPCEKCASLFQAFNLQCRMRAREGILKVVYSLPHGSYPSAEGLGSIPVRGGVLAFTYFRLNWFYHLSNIYHEIFTLGQKSVRWAGLKWAKPHSAASYGKLKETALARIGKVPAIEDLVPIARGSLLSLEGRMDHRQRGDTEADAAAQAARLLLMQALAAQPTADAATLRSELNRQRALLDDLVAEDAFESPQGAVLIDLRDPKADLRPALAQALQAGVEAEKPVVFLLNEDQGTVGLKQWLEDLRESGMDLPDGLADASLILTVGSGAARNEVQAVLDHARKQLEPRMGTGDWTFDLYTTDFGLTRAIRDLRVRIFWILTQSLVLNVPDRLRQELDEAGRAERTFSEQQ